jgi:hypothetical protein
MRTRPPIPDEVRRFVLTSVLSVPFLEAALLLRAEADTVWDAERLSKRLYVSKRHAAELLEQLTTAGFIVPTAKARCWSWGPQPPLADVIEQLAAVYAQDLVGVTELIHARGETGETRARQFADAFRFRKDG